MRPFILMLTWGLLVALPLSLAEAQVPPSPTMVVSPWVEPVDVDLFTGAATTRLPIAVPPGRGGVQPDLALTYHSGRDNGWVGMGWNLDVALIERTEAGSYRLHWDGEPRTLVEIEENDYRAELEGVFLRVERLTAADGQPAFRVTEPTGRSWRFGQTAASRHLAGSSQTEIVRWYADRLEDPDGNHMTLSYTQAAGQVVLKQIEYTGWGSGATAQAPGARAQFYSEARPDGPLGQRLKTITVSTGPVLVRAYTLTYTQSPSTGRSLLTSVQEVGRDATVDATGTVSGGTTGAGVTLQWQTSPVGTYTKTLSTTGSNSNWSVSRVWPGDYNGDGKTDLLSYHGANGVAQAFITFLSNGDGTYTKHFGSVGSNSDWSASRAWPGDYNGDGKTDLLSYHGANGVAQAFITFLSNGDGTYAKHFGSVGSNSDWSASRAWPGDYNGDGKTDLLSYHGANGVAQAFITFLSNGDGTYAKHFGSVGSNSDWSASRAWPGDYNGDGKTDLLSYHGANGVAQAFITFLSNGDGTYAKHFGSVGSNSDWSASRAWPGDYNGDGKTDLLSYHGANGVAQAFITFLSNGDGTYAKHFGSVGSNSDWSASRAWPGDYNGDGKTDLLSYHGANGVAQAFITFLSNGDGTYTKHFGSTGSNSDWSTTLVWPGDYTGDGKTDLLSFHGANGVAQSFITYAAAGPTPDLLTTLTTHLGGTTTVAYTPSTQYANTQLPYPVPTVSAVTLNDGQGTIGTTTYTYAGGYHHLGEDAFRGFHTATVTSPAGPSGEQTITQTWFHQGNDVAVDENDPSGAVGYIQGAPYRTKVTDGAGTLLTETTTTYTADADGQAPYYTPPASVVTKHCDGATCGRTQRTDYRYDAYGNITEAHQYGDTSLTTDDRTLVRTYSPNLSQWFIRQPTQERLHAGLGMTGALLARTDFYYDGTSSCAEASTTQQPTQGHRTRTVSWLAGATSQPETRQAYDQYGNEICHRDAGGHTTTLTYDTSGTFVTTETNALGHVTTTAYYGLDGVASTQGLYGQVARITDANGAVVTREYDVLGRPIKETQADGSWTTTSYEAFGTIGSQHVRTDSSEGLSTWAYVDGLGRVLKTERTGPEKKTVITRTEYDARGALTRTSVPRFVPVISTPPPTESTPDASTEPSAPTEQWTTWQYDGLGRVLRTTAPDGSVTQACYDDGVTMTLDANGHQTRTTRDIEGRVVRVDEYTGVHTTCSPALGSPVGTTRYTYDRVGNLVGITDALGNETTVTYDTLARPTQIQDPNLGTWTAGYDAAGNRIQETDATGATVYAQYDALHREIQRDYGTSKAVGEGDVVYTYDGATKGRLATMRDASGQTAFQYDAVGRVTRREQEVDGVTYTTARNYDGLGRVTRASYPTPFTEPVTDPSTGIATPVNANTVGGFGVGEWNPGGLASHQGQLYMVGGENVALYTLDVTTGIATPVNANTVGGFGVGEWSPGGLASHGGALYLVGASTDALYTLDVTTGVATRVGSATQFGVGEEAPGGLASHQGMLYLVGEYTRALYTLDETTGQATRVGSATEFGVGEWSPGGLASHQGTLYLVGQGTEALYMLDETTGQATRVGSARRFGVNEGAPTGLTSHVGTLYLVGEHTRALYMLDATTGVATLVNQSLLFGVGEWNPGGLASHNGTLYLVGAITDALYMLDETTGQATRVGTAEQFGVREGAPHGLASHNGRLYLVGYATEALYTLDETTGQATRVGNAEQFGVGEYAPTGLASHQGTLYLVGRGTEALYMLDETTGQATRVGSAEQFGVGEYAPRGLASYQGMLYMVGSSTEALYTLDTTTGRATRVGTAEQFGVGEEWPQGLASHQGMLYLVGEDTDALYTLDVNPPAHTETVAYTYTGPSLARVQSGSTSYAAYSGFNALGQPGTITFGNGTTTTYTYDSLTARLKTLKTVHGDTVLQDQGYFYDLVGNLLSRLDFRYDLYHGGLQLFRYDARDRLTWSQSGVEIGSYGYNVIGNLVSHSQVGSYTYNASGAGSTRPHAVTGVGTGTDAETYSYDANGHLVLGGGRQLTWDAEHRLVRVVTGDTTTQLVYDGQGHRVKKTVSTAQTDEETDETSTSDVTTVSIGNWYVCEGKACARVIYAGDQRIALVQEASGATSYFHPDFLGSTGVLTDESGNEEEHIRYEPYGAVHTHEGTSDVVYKYRGQERDASTGLYWDGGRYYDPKLGRFLSPARGVAALVNPQGLNRYTHAMNNPLRPVPVAACVLGVGVCPLRPGHLPN